MEKSRFVQCVSKHFHEDGWPLDAHFGRALPDGKFERSETVCTKILYNYADQGLLGIRNIELPEKLRRRSKTKRLREKKRILGCSNAERPQAALLR